MNLIESKSVLPTTEQIAARQGILGRLAALVIDPAGECAHSGTHFT